MKKAIKKVTTQKVEPIKQPKDTEVSESLFSDKNKGGPFSWKMSKSKPFKEIYNVKLGKL